MKVSLSPEADQDVDSIYIWIGERNLLAADQLLSDIIEFCFLTLPNNPEIGRPYGKSMRVFIKRGYRVIYQNFVDEIIIIRVLHPARNHLGIVPEE